MKFDSMSKNIFIETSDGVVVSVMAPESCNVHVVDYSYTDESDPLVKDYLDELEEIKSKLVEVF